MKSKVALLIVLSCLVFVTLPIAVRAQTNVGCDSIVESQILNNGEIQEYQINLNKDDILFYFAEVLETYSDLRIGLGLKAPNNFVINGLEPHYDAGKYNLVETASLSEAGVHTIQVQGFTASGGTYALHIGCVQAQGTVAISSHKFVNIAQCGSLIENSFSRNNEYHRYYLHLSAGDVVRLSAETFGGYSDLRLTLELVAPSEYVIRGLKPHYDSGTSDLIETAELAETGIYRVTTAGFTGTGGPYRLLIGCTLKNVGVINPGDVAPETTPIPPTTAPTLSPSNPQFLGFPGLAPVDFAAVAKIPMIANVPMTGAVTADGNIVLGYTLDAAANDTLALSFTRLSGNLNLGLVVLSADNKVVFQASLVTASELTTKFTLPTAGQYTIGVFRIDLLPSAAPEPTAFQLQATLNP